MEFAEGAEASRQAHGGERFALVLERLGYVFGMVQTPGAVASAYDNISKSNAVYPVSPRPARGVDVATVDVKTRLERAGMTIAEIVDRVQRAIGSQVKVFSIRPLDLKELSKEADAPARRETEAKEAATSGAGQSAPQKALTAAFAGARQLITTVVVVAVIIGIVVLLKPAREALSQP